MIDLFTDLIERWREEASLLRRYAANDQADVLERLATELEVAAREWELEALTLEQARKESGFGYSTLQRLVSSGRVPNAGDRHRPRIRRKDLPRKPGHRVRKLEVQRAHG